MKLSFLLILAGLINISCSNKPIKDKVYDARLSTFKYPFTVENYSFNSQKQKLEMSYMDLNSSSKKVVVLLHGKNFAGFYWEKVAIDLEKKGYRVLIPDQIGFGKSSKPKNYQYSFPQLALNTSNLLSSLNIRNYTLVGHSMGGMLGTAMANMFESEVKKLILINPIGLENYLTHVKFKEPNFFYKSELNKTYEKMIFYQKKNYYDGKWDKSYEELLGPTSGQIRGPDWKLVAWNNALTYGPIFSENNISRIKSLKVPTTLIIGTRDRTAPGRKWQKDKQNYDMGRYDRLGKKFKSYLPGARVIELKGIGHMPQFEDYNRFSKSFYPLF